MEEYVIYTYGGGEILWQVLNAIALLFKSDSSYFTIVGQLTAAMGLAYAALVALGRNSIPFFFKDWLAPTVVLMGLFFGLKSSVHIIDKVDPTFEYSKVDNVPAGIAAVASLTSRIGDYLAETLETKLSNNEAQRFTKVGPMFGARLIHEASKVTIKDPIMRANIKDFVYQCFEVPYIDSNIDPGRRAAETTTDILGFIASNPHPMLGIYWREATGSSKFMSCEACAAKIREVIAVEVNTGLSALASSLFHTKVDDERTTVHLKKYADSGWNLLAKGSSNIANVIQQELMINSYHAASRNKKDELDLGKYDAALIHLEAERGQAVQDVTSLVKSSLSLVQLPNLHTIILALALIFFTVIAPLTFLPKGLSYIVTWIKVMIWITTWPVLFTVINCLGHMFAAKALNSSLMGLSSGLTLQTQSGLATAAYSAYCFVMGLQYTVSFLSWTLISRAGGHAFSQLSSSFSQIGESFASKAGNEIVDGNVTFDAQTLHHRSLGNEQIAQQQLGTAVNYGSRFDDGKLATIHGAGGSIVAQEHQHSFSTNLSQNDSSSQMAAWQSQEMQSAAHQEGVNLQKSVSLGTQELASFAKSVAENKGVQESFGTAESANLQKQMQHLAALSDRFAAENGLSKQVAFDAMMSASLNGGLGKMFGLSANAGFKAGAVDNELVSKARNSETSKQFSEGLQQAVNYALDNKASIGKAFNTQSLDQAQAHFSEAKVHSESMSAHLSRSQSLSEMASRSRQSGISSASNNNDSMVERVAEQFGGDRLAATQYLAYHPEAAQQESSSLITSTAQPPSSSQSEQQELYKAHAANQEKIGLAPTHNPDLDTKRASHNFAQQEKDLDTQITEKRDATKTELGRAQGQTWKSKSQMAAHHTFADQTYEREKDKSLVGKSMEKAATNIGESTTIKTIGNKVQRLIGSDKGKKR
ncbi:conjugal transfer protein TraG N-terminal domain-containing protein [Candidatus Odyssella thessalonicensis]|uniref:conjugal transfer protein TraG N-terminal domain-containing protein n=1 Tax=Candidatus Odyssella thessalonicensis TaxID=84647 RepID=UPI000225B98D|nr:conjugal transfer protein TraG N-terminal domain-containing protein [Candidatus Odyssella thessalonicensis]